MFDLKGKRAAKNAVSLLLAASMISASFCGCTNGGESVPATVTDEANAPSEEIKLTIAGSVSDFVAIESAAQSFTSKYPNCKIEYEYLQDYKDTLVKRLDANTVDLFITDNIQSDSAVLPYALELRAVTDKLDLSNTFSGLTNNFRYLGSEKDELYAVPIGAEVRGLYVNVTLLDSLGLKVPENRAELLEAAAKLKENGYIAFHGNPGSFSQLLLFPYVTNIIATAENHDEVYNAINACNETAADYFEDPMQFMYTLTENYYYNYKLVENEYNMFLGTDAEVCVSNFLNIVDNGEGYVKKDDMGIVAFMPGTMSMKSVMDKTADNYHSTIKYEFILSPVSDEGGFAYMSPAEGIAVNKNSQNVDWAVRFMNFLFTEENNKRFAEERNIIPNTSDAVSYISNEFDIPEDRITQPEDIAFDYGFYTLIRSALVDVSKGNNPKYMQEDGSLYTFEYYMNGLRQKFTEQRESGEAS